MNKNTYYVREDKTDEGRITSLYSSFLFENAVRAAQ